MCQPSMRELREAYEKAKYLDIEILADFLMFFDLLEYKSMSNHADDCRCPDCIQVRPSDEPASPEEALEEKSVPHGPKCPCLRCRDFHGTTVKKEKFAKSYEGPSTQPREVLAGPPKPNQASLEKEATEKVMDLAKLPISINTRCPVCRSELEVYTSPGTVPKIIGVTIDDNPEPTDFKIKPEEGMTHILRPGESIEPPFKDPQAVVDWFCHAPTWAVQQVAQGLSNNRLYLTLQIGPIDDDQDPR